MVLGGGGGATGKASPRTRVRCSSSTSHYTTPTHSRAAHERIPHLSCPVLMCLIMPAAVTGSINALYSSTPPPEQKKRLGLHLVRHCEAHASGSHVARGRDCASSSLSGCLTAPLRNMGICSLCVGVAPPCSDPIQCLLRPAWSRVAGRRCCQGNRGNHHAATVTCTRRARSKPEVEGSCRHCWPAKIAFNLLGKVSKGHPSPSQRQSHG